MNLPEEKWLEYRRGAQERRRRRRQTLAKRRERAWHVAREAARILKEEFGASRVVVFGSLLNERFFHLRSDVDLAVWGLDPALYLKALGRLLSLDPAIPVDLIEAEHAPPALQERIQKEGLDL